MYALKKDDVLQKLQTTRSGLTDAEIEQRRQTFGRNEIVAKKKETIVHKFFMQFKNVMVMILLISAIISLSLAIYKKEYNDLFEGFVILFIVFLNATIGVIQEVKAEDAIGKLNQSMELKARVYRNGVLVKLPNSELVVGDIVVLQSGDVIPADIRLLETHSLKVVLILPEILINNHHFYKGILDAMVGLKIPIFDVLLTNQKDKDIYSFINSYYTLGFYYFNENNLNYISINPNKNKTKIKK